MIDKERLDGIRKRLSYLEERENRAKDRLAAQIKGYLYFAAFGITAEVDRIEIESLGFFQKVIELPGTVELAGAIKNKSLLSTIGQYSPYIEYEFAITKEIGSNQKCFDVMNHFISVLKMRSFSEFLIPLACDYSWSTISAIKNNTCSISIVENMPDYKIIFAPKPITEDEINWVSKNFLKYLELTEDSRFLLSIQALTEQHLIYNKRLMIASLWAGIEALLSIHGEITFRLSIYIASVLEKVGEKRQNLYKEIKKLYSTRSKVVHGAKLDDAALDGHIHEVRVLLSRLLCKFVEENYITTSEQIEDLVFAN